MTLSLCLHFDLETFCPLFVAIACRRSWTDHFAILWWCTELPNSKSDHHDQAQRHIETELLIRAHLYVFGAEIEIIAAAMSFALLLEDH